MMIILWTVVAAVSAAVTKGANNAELIFGSMDKEAIIPQQQLLCITTEAVIQESVGETVKANALLLLLVTIAASLFTSTVVRWYDIAELSDPIIGLAWGAFLGAGCHYAQDRETMRMVHNALSFNANLFFMVLLPPIVFNNGYSLSGDGGKFFYKNFGTITWFATVGTGVAFLLVGAGWFALSFLLPGVPRSNWRESAAVGALFASTDMLPIIPILNRSSTGLLAILAKGESLLNDGVSIAMYRAAVEGASIKSWLFDFAKVFFGSIAVGFAMGLLTALMGKQLARAAKDQTDRVIETALLVLVIWISYLLADTIGISGIIAILFMGVCISRYAFSNLSTGGKRVTGELFSVCALLAEMTISVLLGVALFASPQDLAYHLPVALLLGLILIVARVAAVVLTSLVVNLCFRRDDTIPFTVQLGMVLCGAKGGVSYALAVRAQNDFDSGTLILNCTLILAVMSMIITSLTVPRLLSSGLLENSLTTTTDNPVKIGTIRRWLVILDHRYIFPLFTAAAAPQYEDATMEGQDCRQSNIEISPIHMDIF